MMALVAITFKAMQYVDYVGKARCFERLRSVNRTAATAADQYDRTLQPVTGEPCNVLHEIRIDLPVRPIAPGNVLDTDRMPDKKILDLAAHIDE